MKTSSCLRASIVFPDGSERSGSRERTPVELKARIGPDATLDDVFIRFVAKAGEAETEESYGQVRQARRAAREHGG
jgi:hypothetical protein